VLADRISTRSFSSVLEDLTLQDVGRKGNEDVLFTAIVESANEQDFSVCNSKGIEAKTHAITYGTRNRYEMRAF
jgi:hypothetical protein